MSNNLIPLSVISMVSLKLAEHYYSHTRIDNLFLLVEIESAPFLNQNLINKCKSCFDQINKTSKNPLRDLGLILQEFMDLEDCSPKDKNSQQKIQESLNKNGLEYKINGIINQQQNSFSSKNLENMFKKKDLSSIQEEFDRGRKYIFQDPHSAITAASSMIEALCKVYIFECNLTPKSRKQTAKELWKEVQKDLQLSIDNNLNKDKQLILQGLTQIVNGVSSYRTHIGSAHGRGPNPPEIGPMEANLALGASQTFVNFILEYWMQKQEKN